MIEEKSYDTGEVELNYAEGPEGGPPLLLLPPLDRGRGAEVMNTPPMNLDDFRHLVRWYESKGFNHSQALAYAWQRLMRSRGRLPR